MPRKYELITDLYNETIHNIAGNRKNWTAFLRSACNNYKLTFDELVLIYAQRPDATAVLEFERWNKRFGRWVNKGATGIAVFDGDHNGQSRLKHFFDVSDTHESRFSRPVPIWSVPVEYEAEVIEALGNSFGELEDSSNFPSALISAANNAVEDNMADYLSDLKYCRENSFLEDLDDYSVEVNFRNTLQNSVAYMLLTRCGLDAEKYFEPEDFEAIADFNTQETINALGVAGGDIARMALSEIALTVQALQKNQKTAIRTFAEKEKADYSKEKESHKQSERGFEYGTDIHEERGLQPAESSPNAGGGDSSWEIRIASENVSEETPQNPLHQSADLREAERTLDGNGADGTHTDGDIDNTDGADRRDYGADEGNQPNEMGGAYEQHPTSSGGINSERPDLQLNSEKDKNAGGDELPAFLDDKLIMGIIANKDDDLKYNKSQIELFFSLHSDQKERAEYLKSAYQDRYTEVLIDGQHVGYKPQEDGLLMWEGAYLSRSAESVFSWGVIAELTTLLVDKKEYFINKDIKALKSEKSQQMSLFEFTDFNTESTGEQKQTSFFRGFTVSQQIVDEALCLGSNEPDSLERICGYFAKDYPLEQNADFLQTEYGRDGKGFYSGNRLISLWFDESGIRISEGRNVTEKRSMLLSWEDTARRIRELLDLGRFAPQSVIDRAEVLDRKVTAQKLMSLVGDFAEEAHERNLLPTVHEIYRMYAGYPDRETKLAETLLDKSVVDNLITEMNVFVDAYKQEPNLLRFHFHRPKEIWERLEGLQREIVKFTALDEPFTLPKQFITENEIDKLLSSGSGISQGKYRIYEYFLQDHTQKERIGFLKNEYGWGGHGRSGFNENHDGKGISYSRGDIFTPYDKVLLKWNEVEKRIGVLIKEKRYMTEKEIAYLPSYEKEQVARGIYNFFHGVSVEMPCPYPRNFEYWDGVKYVSDQLDDPEKSEEIYQMMLPVWESTTQDDSNYESRKKGFEYFVAYREGTFSLFGEKKAPLLPSPSVMPQEEKAEPFSEELEQSEEPTKELAKEEPPAEKQILSSPHKPRERIHFTTLHPKVPSEERHQFQIDDEQLGVGSPNAKYAANVTAIRLLKQIDSEERLATPEEQLILSQYVGWGGLSGCFEEHNENYGELKALLTEEEYASARASSLTAFYTSPVIIKAMYQALSQMGFVSGNILEPACGVGNFIGMLPKEMADIKTYGVELDSISGSIAKQLYQNSNIIINGFEKTEMPDSFFDVAVGNVPFGDFKVLDRRYDKHHWLIHDYFFGKTLDKVRPGGIVAFITSKGTMDKEQSSVRKYLAQRADLIGAIRLPDNAFKKNAGTDVTSDILFLQKRDRMVDIEPEWVHLDTDENGIRMNSYFVQNPDMILGEMVMESTRFGMDSACKPYKDMELSDLLSEAVTNLHAELTAYERDELEEEDISIPADPNVRNFSYTIVDGKVYFRENSRMHPIEVSVTAESRIRGQIALRDCVRQLITYQSEDYPDELIKEEQKRLNTLYDDFTKKYGLICSRGNSLAFGEDSSYYLLCSLEVLDDKGNFKCKADMFSKRTIKPHVPVTSVDTASEALAVSISEKARVDMEYMSALSGKIENELAADLKGVLFRDVNCATEPELIPKAFVDMERFPFVTADEYLSGNVRKKLQMVRALQEILPAEEKNTVADNIHALEGVQPTDLTAGEIGVRIGATWVPAEVYQQFMFETIGTANNAKRRMNILYSKCTGEWNITEKSADYSNIKSVTTYGTKRINAYYILEQTLNLKDVRIFDTIIEDGKEKRVLNKKETAIAQDRQELIKSKFSEWLWKDIDRRERLCHIYNETFNSVRPREYSGEHIIFSGMNPEIALRKHQVDAIAHVMYGGNTLLAHQVGAGKTYEMVAAAMESKRLGLCSKSMIVVPNHITEQWAAEWLQLYPSANILVATKKEFETKNRKKFCARIATGEYDAIIIGHSQFEKIPMSKERQEAIIERQIEEILFGIREATNAKAERYTIKQLERTKKSLENRLEKLNDQSRKDSVVTFEELGVDRVFIDESHYFKNLFLVTKMRNVGGIAQTDAQKSSDLFMKCQYLDEITNGRGIIFATGTPISNSMVELYTIQRYLQYRTLQELGLQHFDEWAANFGETVTAIELSPEGTGYRAKTRFAKFYNLPELMATFKEVADIQTADMLKLPVPKANFHTEVIKPTELQKEMIKGLAERAEIVRNGGVDPSIDNMLKITNDGRKLALDMRLINPLAPDDENNKTSVCARNIYHIWEKSKENRSAQLAFCDLSTPGKKAALEMEEVEGVYRMIPKQFENVYNDLREKLIAKGIPAEEIAFIHEANTEVRKKELFAKVRSGQVRVLMGSTQKMGAGTNVQDRLIALHDLDCPWRPSDLEQRLGRIVRQWNQNPEVEIFRYVTENTFDAYLYQLVENKQKFISQIMTSKTPLRAMEDVDETALNYAEIKALATGNPLIIEKCNLEMEVGKLNMLKANHLSQKYALEEMVIRKYPETIQRLSERIDGYEKDMVLIAAHPKPVDGLAPMEINGTVYVEKEEAGKVILDACTKMTGSDAVHLGQYRGFSVTLAYAGASNEYRMTLKGTLSHTVVLGADVFGNITRIDNALDGFPTKLTALTEDLENTKNQLENAKEEMEAPFIKEAEFAEKSERLKELNILLNMDEKDRSVIDTEPEENTPDKPKPKEYER